jgi:ATP-dependent Clp protease ATP-binding subunit ClpX
VAKKRKFGVGSRDMRTCAICSRPENEVKQLVELTKGGPCICNRCTTTAFGLVGATPKAKDEDKPLPKPREINAYLNDYVIGQNAAKVAISVAVYNHYKRREALKRGKTFDVEIQKSNILIMGPTGSGKTQIARTLAKLLGVPFFVGDATKLTQAGYVGDDVESLLQGLLTACGNDPEKAQWGIIFLDEIDKIARKSGRDGSGYRDVSGEGVQQAILKMLEGSEVRVPRASKNGMGGEYDILDTNNILFICAGSFAGIEESVRRRKNSGASLGFGGTERKKHTEGEVYLSVEEDDILDFGLIPELLGRIPVRTTTIPLTEEEMVRILTEPKDAIVRQFQALYDMDDIDLQFDEEALKAIGQEAKTRPTGARALRGIVERILTPYSYDCPSDPTIKGVRITKEVIDGTGEAAIMRETQGSEALQVAAASS